MSISCSAGLLYFCGALQLFKSAPSSVFRSLLVLSWEDFKPLRYPNQNTARDLPLS